MKRLLLLLLASMLGASVGWAQFSVGVAGHVQRLSLSGDTPDDQIITPALGYGFGVTSGYFVTQDVELTLSALYDIRKNGISNVLPKNDSLQEVGTVKMSSFSVPIGVRVYTKSRTWYLSSGVNVRFTGQSDVTVISSDSTFSVTDAFVRFELGLFLGVGYAFNVGGIRLIPEIRYEQGISNMLNGNGLTSLPPAPVLRSNGFSFRFFAEYAFGGGQ